MYAISVRAPWTWYLLWAGKDIENRGLRFPRHVRGRILLHASKWWVEEEIRWGIKDANEMWAKRYFRAHGAPQLTFRHLQETRGCIVGSIEVVDYVERSDTLAKNSPILGQINALEHKRITINVLQPSRAEIRRIHCHKLGV